MTEDIQDSSDLKMNQQSIIPNNIVSENLLLIPFPVENSENLTTSPTKNKSLLYLFLGI